MVQGYMLLVLLLIAILVLIFLIAKVKLHAFLALLIVAFGLGIAAGLNPVGSINTVSTGFGNSVKAIGIVILFGTIIGTVLDKSYAALTMAETVLKLVGPKRPALAMNIIGWIVSIPVFCDSGYVILSSLNNTLAKRSGVPMAVMAVALSTGLYATHTLVPPTPGPIAAAGNLHADLGLVIVFGLIVSVPAALAGYWWATRAGGKYPAEKLEAGDLPTSLAEGRKLPSVFKSFSPIVIPIALIGLRSLFVLAFAEGNVIRSFFNFVGDPIIALFIGLLLCILLVPNLKEEVLTNWVSEGIKDAAAIIVITASGGSLGAIIAETHIGDFLGSTLAQYNLGIFLPFIVAAALKTAQGSSTVALITASTIVYPLLATLGLATPVGAALAVSAVGCGSMVVSHSNDSYFWVVSQFSGLKVDVAYKVHTVATLLQGLVGIVVVWVLVKIFV